MDSFTSLNAVMATNTTSASDGIMSFGSHSCDPDSSSGIPFNFEHTGDGVADTGFCVIAWSTHCYQLILRLAYNMNCKLNHFRVFSLADVEWSSSISRNHRSSSSHLYTSAHCINCRYLPLLIRAWFLDVSAFETVYSRISVRRSTLIVSTFCAIARHYLPFSVSRSTVVSICYLLGRECLASFIVVLLCTAFSIFEYDCYFSTWQVWAQAYRDNPKFLSMIYHCLWDTVVWCALKLPPSMARNGLRPMDSETLHCGTRKGHSDRVKIIRRLNSLQVYNTDGLCLRLL